MQKYRGIVMGQRKKNNSETRQKWKGQETIMSLRAWLSL
jgi:hypothetical protein